MNKTFNLYKYLCGGCNTELLLNEKLRECYECDSSLLTEDKNLTSEDYLKFCEIELECANHPGYVELPRKIFNKIKRRINMDGELEFSVAKIICEEFYNNI